ncbi:FDXHR family putative zinc-binding protein [Wenzhouxiangella indolica]
MPQTNHPLSANRFCRCSSCSEVFSGVAQFARHRRKFGCLNPEVVGLVIGSDSFGTFWADPVSRTRLNKTLS